MLRQLTSSPSLTRNGSTSASAITADSSGLNPSLPRPSAEPRSWKIGSADLAMRPKPPAPDARSFVSKRERSRRLAATVTMIKLAQASKPIVNMLRSQFRPAPRKASCQSDRAWSTVAPDCETPAEGGWAPGRPRLWSCTPVRARMPTRSAAPIPKNAPVVGTTPKPTERTSSASASPSEAHPAKDARRRTVTAG